MIEPGETHTIFIVPIKCSCTDPARFQLFARRHFIGNQCNSYEVWASKYSSDSIWPISGGIRLSWLPYCILRHRILNRTHFRRPRCSPNRRNPESRFPTALVTPATITAWLKRIDDKGANALLQLREPVNKFPEFVRYIVQRLTNRLSAILSIKNIRGVSRRRFLKGAPTRCSHSLAVWVVVHQSVRVDGLDLDRGID